MVEKLILASLLALIALKVHSKSEVLTSKVNGKEINLIIKVDKNIVGKYYYFESSNYKISIIDKKYNEVSLKLIKNKEATRNNIFIRYFSNKWKSEPISVPGSVFGNPSFKNAEILVEIDKQNVSYGDGVVIKYSLLSSSQYLNYRISKFPSYQGFIKRFTDPGNITRPISDGGRLKYITPLYYVELFPLANKEKIVNEMEIIINENMSDQYVISSVDPNFKFIESKNTDLYSKIKISYPEGHTFSVNNSLSQDFEVKLSGRGMLEKVNDLSFTGKIVKDSKVTLVSQEYRPGFASKTFRVQLTYYPNVSGMLEIFFGNRLRDQVHVDSFIVEQNNEAFVNNQYFTQKLIQQSTLSQSSIMLLLSLITCIFFLFPKKVYFYFNLILYLIKLKKRQIFPINNYEVLVNDIFDHKKYGPYFCDKVIVKNSASVETKLVLRKIESLINSYGERKKTTTSISFFDLVRLILSLNKDGLWKF